MFGPMHKKPKGDRAGMGGEMESTQEMRHFDATCGIHGVARARAGAKRGAATAQRRWNKVVVESEMEALAEETDLDQGE